MSMQFLSTSLGVKPQIMIVCLAVLGSLKMADFLLLNSNTAAECRAEALGSCLLTPTPVALSVTGLEEPVRQVG